MKINPVDIFHIVVLWTVTISKLKMCRYINVNHVMHCYLKKNIDQKYKSSAEFGIFDD